MNIDKEMQNPRIASAVNAVCEYMRDDEPMQKAVNKVTRNPKRGLSNREVMVVCYIIEQANGD